MLPLVMMSTRCFGIALVWLCLIKSGSSLSVEVNGVQLSRADIPDDPILASLFPAELEDIDDAGHAALIQSNVFQESIPERITIDQANAPGARVFSVVGDAMGVLGFHMCDIEHYMNHTLPACSPRAGWASKIAEAYGDKLYLTHNFVRSADNAMRVHVPLLLKQFHNSSDHLKLAVIALGSKYAGLNIGHNYTHHLTAAVNAFQSRGTKVILMTRPLIDPHPRAPLFFNNYNTTIGRKIVEATKAVALHTNAACLDTWELFQGLGDRWREALGPDGVHYSSIGQELIFQGLMDLIRRHYPELSPENIFTGDAATSGPWTEERVIRQKGVLN